MEKSYTETMILRPCDCDMRGDWRPSAVLEAMQETAGAHCDRLGIGRGVLDALGIIWVLSRARVSFTRVPRHGERIAVETWPLPCRHLFFPRVNRFTDAEGNDIGGASSLWLLLDVATRRIVMNDTVLAHLPGNADLSAGPGAPNGVRPLAIEPRRDIYRPVYTDFDLNGHVNNTRYMDWCCNALGADVLAERQIAQFDIAYESEVLPGAAIDTELALDGERFSFFGGEAGKRHFGISGALSPRKARE